MLLAVVKGVFWICLSIIFVYRNELVHNVIEVVVLTPSVLKRIYETPSHTMEVMWDVNLINPYKSHPGAPNIILILADDLGVNDLSGGAGVLTPNIDSIAKNGINFTTAYAAQATCAPSRATLFTGRNPTEIGFEYTPVPKAVGRIFRMLLGTPLHPSVYFQDKFSQVPLFRHMRIPKNVSTIAEELKPLGHNSYLMGKWHLGGSPNDRGFDETIWFPQGISPYLGYDDPNRIEGVLNGTWEPYDTFFRYSMPFAVSHNNGPKFKPTEYLTDYLSNQAARFIEQYSHAPKLQKHPFFLALTYTAPHTPLQALKSDFESEEVAHIDSRIGRIYASMIKALDRGVGTVLQSLKENNQLENTLIVFTSDNGAAHILGLPQVNAPYRGWKATFFEGGIRVPLFMQWKNHIPTGVAHDEVVTHKDLFQTFKELAFGTTSKPATREAGITEAGEYVQNSRNILSYLSNSPNSSDTDSNSSSTCTEKVYFWRAGHNRAIRYQDWKLILFSNPDRFWFFDLKADPTEQVNLASHVLATAIPTTTRLLQAFEELKRNHGKISRAPSSSSTLKATLMHIVGILLDVDAKQVEPLWPALVELAIPIDKTDMDPLHPLDEYIYSVN
jgi:arylsulfatase A-like enzyme